MKKEIALLQDLIDALDDTSAFYLGTAHKVMHLHFWNLLQRIAQSHRLIADDLAGSMTAADGSVARGGSLWGPLRMLRTEWQARINFNTELAYAIRAEECEERVLRRCHDAMAGAVDAELRHALELHHRKIERAFLDLSYLASLRRLQANPVPRTRDVVPLPGRWGAQRTATRKFDRFEAWTSWIRRQNVDASDVCTRRGRSGNHGPERFARHDGVDRGRAAAQ